MKATKLGSTVCVSLFVVALLSCGEDARDKRDWSIVQAVEDRFRGNIEATNLLFVETHGLHLVGIRIQGAAPILSPPPKIPRTWIALNSLGPVKQVPEAAEYSVSMEELNTIMRRCSVTPSVLKELEKHVRK